MQNIRDDTALMLASMSGHTEVIKLLLNCGKKFFFNDGAIRSVVDYAHQTSDSITKRTLEPGVRKNHAAGYIQLRCPDFRG